MFKLIFIFYMVQIVTGVNGPLWPGPQSVVPNGNGGSSWTAQVRNNVPGQVTTYTGKLTVFLSFKKQLQASWQLIH